MEPPELQKRKDFLLPEVTMDFDDIPAAEDAEVVLVAEDSSNYLPAVEESNNFLPDPEPAEEDALTKFNREWNIKLDKKREAEFEKEKSVRATADEEKAQWNQQRDVRLKAKQDKNRTEEHVLKEQLASEAENLKSWDRVAKLIDAGETESKGSDTTRMRKLFIQVKNEPLESTRADN